MEIRPDQLSNKALKEMEKHLEKVSDPGSVRPEAHAMAANAWSRVLSALLSKGYYPTEQRR